VIAYMDDLTVLTRGACKIETENYANQDLKNLFPNINLKSVSTKEIKYIIKSLNLKNSSVYDGISTKLLKKAPPLLPHL
jgi:hypothetical protein